METLLIKNINTSLLQSLVRIGDLYYFEGPLLSLFQNSISKNFYLFDWVDRDKVNNRWLVYQVSHKALFDFINNKISHFNLYRSNPDNKFYIVDIENKSKYTDYNLSELESVPSAYYPNKDNYFDESDTRNMDKIRTIVNSRKISFNSNLIQNFVIHSHKNPLNHINLVNYDKKYIDNSSFINPKYKQIEVTFENHFLKSKFKNIVRNTRLKKINKLYA
jgi:hypothetical protein